MRCIILTPLYDGADFDWITPKEDDFLICADGGLAAAQRCDLHPALLVGDFDSMPQGMSADVPTIRLPVEKDDTDLVVCIREGRKRGYREFIFAGSIGGRFDHTLASLQCAADCAMRGEQAWLVNRQNRLTVLAPGAYTLPRMGNRKLSLLAYSPEVTCVTLKGAKWELTDYTLSYRYPLGCSNEFAADEVALSFKEGLLMVSYCRDLC